LVCHRRNNSRFLPNIFGQDFDVVRRPGERQNQFGAPQFEIAWDAINRIALVVETAAIKDKSALWGHVPFSDASTLTVLVNLPPLVAAVVFEITRANIFLCIVYSRFRVHRVDRWV
jgi:hypothetical protein